MWGKACPPIHRARRSNAAIGLLSRSRSTLVTACSEEMLFQFMQNPGVLNKGTTHRYQTLPQVQTPAISMSHFICAFQVFLEQYTTRKAQEDNTQLGKRDTECPQNHPFERRPSSLRSARTEALPAFLPKPFPQSHQGLPQLVVASTPPDGAQEHIRIVVA